LIHSAGILSLARVLLPALAAPRNPRLEAAEGKALSAEDAELVRRD